MARKNQEKISENMGAYFKNTYRGLVLAVRNLEKESAKNVEANSILMNAHYIVYDSLRNKAEYFLSNKKIIGDDCYKRALEKYEKLRDRAGTALKNYKLCSLEN